jgi:hypothetical protein
MTDDNKRVVLIAAPPSMGKTHSLYKMADDPGVAYLNTDLKDLPFRVPKKGMKVLKVEEPQTAIDAIDDLEDGYPEVHTVILDTITFLMDQYENQIVLDSSDTRKAWQGYAQFYKNLMHKIKCSSKNYIILAHTFTEYKEEELTMETRVPIKGSVGKTGIEADFNIVLSCKKVTLKALEKEGVESDFLTISKKEERLGFKYVFQTELTKKTLSEKIRSPMGLWEDGELYIDNDISHITQRLSEYYS